MDMRAVMTEAFTYAADRHAKWLKDKATHTADAADAYRLNAIQAKTLVVEAESYDDVIRQSTRMIELMERAADALNVQAREMRHQIGLLSAADVALLAVKDA